ncbi:hypothetical protein TB1_008894 [Malus domestica]
MVSCVSDTARSLSCQGRHATAHLKLISIDVIFITSIDSISSPVLLSRYFQGKAVYDKATFIIKCFTAGVILSTSIVHVLPDASLTISIPTIPTFQTVPLPLLSLLVFSVKQNSPWRNEGWARGPKLAGRTARQLMLLGFKVAVFEGRSRPGCRGKIRKMVGEREGAEAAAGPGGPLSGVFVNFSA